MNLIMKDFEEHFLAHHPGHVHLEPGATAHSGSSIRRLTSASRHCSLRQPCLPTSVPPVCAGVKVKLTVQDDVYSGTVLEQAVVIEYVIINVQVSLAFVPNLPAP